MSKQKGGRKNENYNDLLHSEMVKPQGSVINVLNFLCKMDRFWVCLDFLTLRFLCSLHAHFVEQLSGRGSVKPEAFIPSDLRCIHLKRAMHRVKRVALEVVNRFKSQTYLFSRAPKQSSFQRNNGDPLPLVDVLEG